MIISFWGREEGEVEWNLSVRSITGKGGRGGGVGSSGFSPFLWYKNHWEPNLVCIWSPFFLIISMEGMAMVFARWRTAAGVGRGRVGGMGTTFCFFFCLLLR
jgi:hypothetical protein